MFAKKENKLERVNSKKKFLRKIDIEDTTEYGEFVSTFYHWLTLDEQKRNANYLANIEKMNQRERENERFKGM